ncbi:MAG: hypothetical protein KME13_18025 [Myxacorys californica WJT36-NPBG1]|nr:hypothetical protein [Myxacorys californica WJT36-NPBG1]
MRSLLPRLSFMTHQGESYECGIYPRSHTTSVSLAQSGDLIDPLTLEDGYSEGENSEWPACLTK